MTKIGDVVFWYEKLNLCSGVVKEIVCKMRVRVLDNVGKLKVLFKKQLVKVGNS